MMGLEDIIAGNLESAAAAARRNRRPHIPEGPEEVDSYPPFPFPNLGAHVPDGWELTEVSWLVDKTGSAPAWEVAHTVHAFRDAIRQHILRHPDHGFAITEDGPHQAVVAAIRPVFADEAQRADAPSEVIEAG